MTEMEWGRLLFESPELHHKIVIRRVGDGWRVAHPMYTNSVGRRSRWIHYRKDFESTLLYLRTEVLA